MLFRSCLRKLCMLFSCLRVLKQRVLLRGKYSLLSFVLFVKVFVFYIDFKKELNPNSTDFYCSFYCCVFPPLSRAGVGGGGFNAHKHVKPFRILYVPVPSQEPVVQWLSVPSQESVVQWLSPLPSQEPVVQWLSVPSQEPVVNGCQSQARNL